MNYTRLLKLTLLAGVLSGVYIFDFRKAWAAEADARLPVPALIEDSE